MMWGLMLIVSRKGKSGWTDPQVRTVLAERYLNKQKAAEMRLFQGTAVNIL